MHIVKRERDKLQRFDRSSEMFSPARVGALKSKQFHNSTADFPLIMSIFFQSLSIHSRPPSPSFHNYSLRKRRKYPLPNSPYKTQQWQQSSLAHQLSMQLFLNQSSSADQESQLLSTLIHSFAAYSCEPTPNAYYFMLKTLTRKRPENWEHQISQVVDHLEKVATFETPDYILIYLIKYYAKCGMTRHAVDLFFRIPKFRSDPSVDALNALLSGLLSDGNEKGLEIVPEILTRSAREMNIRLESSTLDILITGLCRGGKVNQAVELLKSAVNDGFDLGRNVFSRVIARMCEGKDDDVLGFVEEMKTLAGFVPGMGDWCNVLGFMVKRGEALEAMAVLKQMRREGLRPDIVCCNWVLNGLVKKGEHEKADQLFDEMLVWGLVPDIFSFNAKIRSLCERNNLAEAVKMLDCMEEVGGGRPDLNTYNIILGACCRNGELILGRSIVSKMEKNGVKLHKNSHIYQDMMIEEK
ncbi:OLC1v1033573C1 [Oldenlandia corymbosa var. corymbosa]|uniref:OLC1v1033573C1 n=1 Tax=Oldenlandia corymbosa var. corymbosa TaxID=529605 RepID=A0AAV1CQ78_OLDCO|nr:OLC1v1033573C1 [Oldenlandia corymbosa var. corymbosa]